MNSINEAFPKKKVSANQLECLAHALKNLEIYLDPRDKRCSVSAEARWESHAYLNNWVKPYLLMLLYALAGDPAFKREINEFADCGYFENGYDRLEKLFKDIQK